MPYYLILWLWLLVGTIATSIIHALYDENNKHYWATDGVLIAVLVAAPPITILWLIWILIYRITVRFSR